MKHQKEMEQLEKNQREQLEKLEKFNEQVQTHANERSHLRIKFLKKFHKLCSKPCVIFQEVSAAIRKISVSSKNAKIYPFLLTSSYVSIKRHVKLSTNS